MPPLPPPPKSFSIMLDALTVNLAHLETQKGHSDCMDNLKHAHLPSHLSITGDAGLAIVSWNRLRNTLITEIDRLMCKKWPKWSTFDNSHLA